MTQNKNLPGLPISFEEMKIRADEFIGLINEHSDYNYIICDHIIKEFREYYTPNIPYYLYTDQADERIYVKNGAFILDFETISDGYVIVNQVNPKDDQGLDAMSFREFMYVYCNPEGLYLLEKIGFLVNTLNYDKEDQDRRKALGLPSIDELTSMDYDDDIPF